MPLATRPNATYKVVLSTDMKLPRKQRPVFIFRYLSLVEWELVAELNDKFEVAANSTEMINLALDVIKKTLVGWETMKTPAGRQIPFNIKKLKSLIALTEMTELMQAAVAQRPSVEDKKKLD